MTFLPDLCAVGFFENFHRKSARIYILSKLLFLFLSFIEWELEIFFGNPIEMSALFCLCIVVSFIRMGYHRQYQYSAGPEQYKDRYLARQNMYIFDFLSWKWQNSITQGLKRCVHFEVRLIMVFICSLSTIIYFVHRKESGKLVLLVFAPLAAININITRL